MAVVEIGITEIAGVEHVEHIECDPQRGPRKVREVLAQPDIDCLVRKGARERHEEIVSRWRKGSLFVTAGRAESDRATHIEAGTATESGQGPELDPAQVGGVDNPVGRYAKLAII